MKSRTLFCNRTVLKKDITRYAPLWGLYTVLLLTALLLKWVRFTDTVSLHCHADASVSAYFAGQATFITRNMGKVNFIYACICAVALFGDLFNTKSCYALHSMPLRREEWFLTHCVCGMLFCMVPNTFVALVGALLLQNYWYFALIWLAVMLLQFLFFFSVGAFCAICAGNRLGLVAIYGFFNFLPIVCSSILSTFYAPFLYGINLDTARLSEGCPLVGFSTYYFRTNYHRPTAFSDPGDCSFLGVNTDSWRYLFICVGIGLVLLFLTAFLYRRRKLERSGNLIVFSFLRPVFSVLFALFASLFFYFLATKVQEQLRYIFMAIGVIVGFFTGRMLLERKVNVFRGKTFLSFIILIAAFALSVGLTALDPLGIVDFVPKTKNVKQVELALLGYSSNEVLASGVLNDSEMIEALTDAHQSILDTRPEGGRDPVRIQITYKLRGGFTVERQYTVRSTSPESQALKKILSSSEYILGTNDTDALLESAYWLHFHSGELNLPSLTIGHNYSDTYSDTYCSLNHLLSDPHFTTESLGSDVKGLNAELTQGLIEAIKADCAAGKMAQHHSYHTSSVIGHITIRYYAESTRGIFSSDPTEEALTFKIYRDCDNTMAYLKSLSKKSTHSKRPG